MQGMGQPRQSVGETRGGVHRDTGLPSQTPPGIGHVDRGLLVSGIDEAEIHVGHDVQYRQDVIAGNRENIAHPF